MSVSAGIMIMQKNNCSNVEEIKCELWKRFLDEWCMQFNDASDIFKYFRSYSENMKEFRIFRMPDSIELEVEHKNWLYLLTQFEHKDEIIFFKPYWVNLDCEGYDMFIDLSEAGYPIFRAVFYPGSKVWDKQMYFRSASELLEVIHDNEVVKDYVSWLEPMIIKIDDSDTEELLISIKPDE